MKDYEMYDNDIKIGVTNIYWENINNKYKNSIIKSIKGAKYNIVNIEETIQMYEVEYILNNKDELYDIVSKYIDEDKMRFIEIDNILKHNKIKKIKKEQTIKILVSEKNLNNLGLNKNNIDLNSLINSKIYFIKKVCEVCKLEDIKIRLNKIITNFKSIINSIDYSTYTDLEKNNIQNKALNTLNELINDIENKTNYKYGKQYNIPLKIKI